ncbi:Putative methyltransferase superfamily [Verrucomicrobiia bacterium DG1235]|nr:Putative methyltransferase superfamily [Verrucomicrobiae bacterium DG1235]
MELRRNDLEEKLAELFPCETKLSLEIGCGHGHWLVDYAAGHPEKSCLGVDLIQDRVSRAGRKRDRAKLGNVQFVKGEAFEVIDLLPAHVRLSEVFILFPDPWPKKRHWKNRIFRHAFLSELAKRCDSGVRCHFRTDYEPYFEWATEVVAEEALWRRDEEIDWPFEKETVFQRRADSFQSMIIVRK